MTDPVLATLRRRLVASAADEGLLDVAYRTVDSPVGRLLLATTPAGLVRVAFEAPARLDDVARQLDDYFAGRRRTFDVTLDRQLSAGFRRTVLEHLAADVAYGTTASYAALAGLAGNPRAVRAVGSACATNPIPLVVPCHRVVRSDGTSGAYRGGPEAKRLLLTLEAGQAGQAGQVGQASP